MRRRTQYALAFALVVALTAGVVGSGWALGNPYKSTIVNDFSQNDLTARVTYNPVSGLYHYEYTLVYLEAFGDEPLTDFSVGNIHNRSYTNATSSIASFSMVESSQDSVYFYIPYGDAPTGTTVTFSYDSVHPFGLANVTLAGGLFANGQTLGMSPEPSSLLAVAFGLGGVLWTRLRRRS